MQAVPGAGATGAGQALASHSAWELNCFQSLGASHGGPYSQQVPADGLLAHTTTAAHAVPGADTAAGHALGSGPHGCEVHVHAPVSVQLQVLQPSPAGLVSL